MTKKYTCLIVVMLIFTSCLVFGRITDNQFINFDDPLYITANSHVQSGFNSKNIKWAFTAVIASNWHPLTLFSHMLDWSLFGANASGHHIMSLLLHIGVVIFLFLFLNKTTNNIWSAACAAAFFALHPLRVESVAWAAERKDVLSMFFGMASIYVYAFYADRSKLSQYFLCLILFMLALMSKPMLVTLPFVFMLFDYWPLGRWEKAMAETEGNRFKEVIKLIGEKIPFMCLSIASIILTLWAQIKGMSVAPLCIFPFFARFTNAIISYITYLKKIFYPIYLTVFYPYDFFLPLWKVLIAGFTIIAITAFVLYCIRKWPFLFVGWFLYLGTLLPVIGLVQVGEQALADRYLYLPSIGIVIMLVWGIPLMFRLGKTRKKILLLTIMTIILIMSVLTWKQCGLWKNSMAIWNHALRVTKNNDVAHNNKGYVHYSLGQYQKAFECYSAAIRIKPENANYYNNRGIIFFILGQYQKAMEDFSKAIHLNPSFAEAYNNRVVIYAQQGQYQLAINDLNKAITANPDDLRSYINFAAIYGKLNQYSDVIKNLNEAIRLQPDNALFYYNRGFAYAKIFKYTNAIKDFDKAIQENENYAEAYNIRAAFFLNQRNIISGCRDAKKACALGNCKSLESAKETGLCH